MTLSVYKLKTSTTLNTQEVQDRVNLRAVERVEMKLTTTRSIYLENLALMLHSRRLKSILQG